MRALLVIGLLVSASLYLGWRSRPLLAGPTRPFVQAWEYRVVSPASFWEGSLEDLADAPPENLFELGWRLEAANERRLEQHLNELGAQGFEVLDAREERWLLGRPTLKNEFGEVPLGTP